jgi:hypothetical protein
MSKTNSTNSMAFFSVFGFALSSGYSLLGLNGDDRDEGIDPAVGVYRGVDGVLHQVKPNLDGRFDDPTAEEGAVFELRQDLFGDEAWHDADDTSYTRGVEDDDEVMPVATEDRYSQMAALAEVNPRWADLQRDQSVVCRNNGTRIGHYASGSSFHGTDVFYHTALVAHHESMDEWRETRSGMKASWLKQAAPSAVSPAPVAGRTVTVSRHARARIVPFRGLAA